MSQCPSSSRRPSSTVVGACRCSPCARAHPWASLFARLVARRLLERYLDAIVVVVNRRGRDLLVHGQLEHPADRQFGAVGVRSDRAEQREEGDQEPAEATTRNSAILSRKMTRGTRAKVAERDQRRVAFVRKPERT